MLKRPETTDQPTQKIEPETLAECARRWRDQLASEGLCKPISTKARAS